MSTLEINGDVLAEFCQRNHIRRLSLFGSRLRAEHRPDSDIDLLVEFDPDHVPGYFGLVAMERDLTRILGFKADLRTGRELSRRFRDAILRDARPLYATS